MSQLDFLNHIHEMSLDAIREVLTEHPEWMHPGQEFFTNDNKDLALSFWKMSFFRLDILRMFLDMGFILFDEKMGDGCLGWFTKVYFGYHEVTDELRWFFQNYAREMIERDRLPELMDDVNELPPDSIVDMIKGGLGKDVQVVNPCLLHIVTMNYGDESCPDLVEVGISPYCKCDEGCWFTQLHTTPNRYDEISCIAEFGWVHPRAAELIASCDPLYKYMNED